MKLLARTFLVLFIAFLFMPTILTLIEKASNSVQFLDVSEEEYFKKEAVNFIYINTFEPLLLIQKSIEIPLIHFDDLSKYDKILRVIFSPPPNI